MNAQPPPGRSTSAVFAYAQLFRLPALFTAFADVLLGYFIAYGPTNPYFSGTALAMLLAASGFLYTAGMVLNDVYDAEIDARERPQRPIPSGRVPLEIARLIGFEFLIIGMAFGWGVSWLDGSYRPGMIASVLALAVVMYDKVLKRTPATPLVMGSCRFLNVLLGMSTLARPVEAWHYVIAGGIGLYIAGVTWFARTESRTSNRWLLLWGIAVMAIGLGMVAWFPNWFLPPGEGNNPMRYTTVMLLLAALILWRPLTAVLDPSPARVQFAVKHCLLALIVLDATVCQALVGGYAGMFIIVLLIPTLGLGYYMSGKAIT